MIKTAIAAALFCAAGSMASAVTQDFESFSALDDITGTDLGGFSLSAGSDPVMVVGGNYFGTGNFIQTVPFDNINPFRADFSVAGVSTVSVDIGDNNGDADDLYLFAFDAADNALAFDSVSILDTYIGFKTLTVSAADISYVLFGGHGLNDNNNLYADNFTYDTALVPLPAGGILLLTALLGLGAAKRRKS